jgi:chromosome segregation ATPase
VDDLVSDRQQRARIEHLDAEAVRLEAESSTLALALEAAQRELKSTQEQARQVQSETLRLGAEDAELARLITQMEGVLRSTTPFNTAPRVRPGLVRRAWRSLRAWWRR